MAKSATEVMREAIFAAVVDALEALKSASRGMPNTLLRDIGAIHANSTFTDLPPELQAAITASVRDSFNRLLKEGYSVAPGRPEPPRPPREGPAPGARRPPRHPHRHDRKPSPRKPGKPR